MNNNRKMNFRPAPSRSWNYNEPSKKRRSAGSILFTVAIVFFSLTLIGMIVIGIGEYRDSLTWYDYHESEDELLRECTYENYASLLTNSYNDSNVDRKYTETELALHAVAEYYEAATMVRAFEAAGDEEKAAIYRKRMEELPEKMGEFAESTEKIDEIVFGQ